MQVWSGLQAGSRAAAESRSIGRRVGRTPSNVGTRFHSFLYAELNLDSVYKAFTTTDLAAAIAGIRALGIGGCGVSMPDKEACLELVDEVDASRRRSGR